MQPSDRPGKPSRAAGICLGTLALLVLAAICAYFLVPGAPQVQAGHWGVGLVPADQGFVDHGLITVYEGVGTGGGETSLEGGLTRIPVPEGLIHTRVRQWGRLRWWRTRVLREPGTFDPRDARRLARQMMGTP